MPRPERPRLYFGTDRDVLAAGFPPGGSAPYGFRPGAVVGFYLDATRAKMVTEWIYSGSGDNTKTLRVRWSDFLRIVSSCRLLA